MDAADGAETPDGEREVPEEREGVGGIALENRADDFGLELVQILVVEMAALIFGVNGYSAIVIMKEGERTLQLNNPIPDLMTLELKCGYVKRK